MADATSALSPLPRRVTRDMTLRSPRVYPALSSAYPAGWLSPHPRSWRPRQRSARCPPRGLQGDAGGSDQPMTQSAARPDRCTDPRKRGLAPAAARPAPSIAISALAHTTSDQTRSHNPHSAHPPGSFNPASMTSACHPCGSIAVAPAQLPNGQDHTVADNKSQCRPVS